MEASFISFHDLSPEGRYQYASPSITALLGYTPQEVVGHPAYDYFLDEEIPACRALHQQTVAMEKVAVIVHCRMKHKFGHYVKVSIVSNLSSGCIVSSTCLADDSEKLRAREMTSQEVHVIEANGCVVSKSWTRRRDAPLPRAFEDDVASISEIRACLILDRFTADLEIAFATTSIQDVLGGCVTQAWLRGRALVDLIHPKCLDNVRREVARAKSVDGICHMRFSTVGSAYDGDDLDIEMVVMCAADGLIAIIRRCTPQLVVAPPPSADLPPHLPPQVPGLGLVILSSNDATYLDFAPVPHPSLLGSGSSALMDDASDEGEPATSFYSPSVAGSSAVADSEVDGDDHHALWARGDPRSLSEVADNGTTAGSELAWADHHRAHDDEDAPPYPYPEESADLPRVPHAYAAQLDRGLEHDPRNVSSYCPAPAPVPAAAATATATPAEYDTDGREYYHRSRPRPWVAPNDAHLRDYPLPPPRPSAALHASQQPHRHRYDTLAHAHAYARERGLGPDLDHDRDRYYAYYPSRTGPPPPPQQRQARIQHHYAFVTPPTRLDRCIELRFLPRGSAGGGAMGRVPWAFSPQSELADRSDVNEGKLYVPPPSSDDDSGGSNSESSDDGSRPRFYLYGYRCRLRSKHGLSDNSGRGVSYVSADEVGSDREYPGDMDDVSV
ncbi:hypothetical protein H9P43_008526 [Blastocladiella emersonii ATCC 22665]|nr:hypothetical protein H9P43_008526 [Blastocladiella emersonii ATCC 22665]